jgi:Xaa-Pro dipeptidase
MPGATEKSVNDAVFALAQEMFGISTYWHKRIVLAGANTLAPYAQNPPDLTIGSDDIVFLDCGAVFEKWEADFGRTFVVGSEPLKIKLQHVVGEAFATGKRYFNEHPAITSSDLFQYACDLSARYGWEFGGPMAGHLIGNFPHEKIAGDKISLYIHPQSDLPMRSFDANGHQRHWILEVHFVDRKRQIGGFYEELLTV